ncbi:MAG: polymer-forming cytoskeletal protein, partial [Anaerolineales bacterium]|nr:polymer-forming cytoskeletal protein [Anaerolineales bacterium]
MKKVLLACLLGLLLAFSATPVFADGDGGRVIFGDSFTLESGERMDGDLVVLGGSVVLETGSRVDANVVVMGGSAMVAGEVEGDVVVFGGNVVLRSTAVVDGDLVTIGGNVQRAAGAVVGGNEVKGLEFEGLPRIEPFPTRLRFDTWGNR